MQPVQSRAIVSASNNAASEWVKIDVAHQRGLMMKIVRFSFAITLAIFGPALLLQHAAAERAPKQIYIPLVTVSVPTKASFPPGPKTPASGIRVTAYSTNQCDELMATPVIGARVTVITDHDTYIAMTDESGAAVFGATQEPATVQIEWPAGFLPCPGSRPIVELPDGAGRVKFLAIPVP